MTNDELRDCISEDDEANGLMRQAADEIARLRAELAAERVWHKEARKALKLTRKALEPFVDLRRARDAIASIDAVLKETGAGMSDDIAQDKQIAKLREALEECADDAEAEIKARHGWPEIRMETRFVRDMQSVYKARAVLEETGGGGGS
jgi:hypothetical protein